MNIVLLHDQFPSKGHGGAAVSTEGIALGLKAAGHEVSVITTCRSEAEAGEMDFHGIRVWKIATDYPDRWRWYVSLYNRPVVRKVEAILRELRPDIVHANNIHQYLSYHCLKIAKRHAKKVVFTSRDATVFNFAKLTTKRYLERFDYRTYWFDHLRQAGKRWNPFRNMLVRWYLRRADKIIAISGALKEALRQNGIDGAEVIYNGIDAELWQTTPAETRDFRKVHGLAGKKVILFGGRLSPAKGARQAIEALHAIVETVPEARLVVMGRRDGYADTMMKDAEELGIAGHIAFTGWIDGGALRAAYGAADVVWMPSVCFDSFGRVNIEAMAAKRPVVGTCFGGTPEIVEDGTTGFIINPLYPNELSEKTLVLLSDPKRARAFGQAGYKRVIEQFNLKDKIAEIVGVYEDLLGEKDNGLLVAFGETLPDLTLSRYKTVVAPQMLREKVEALGFEFKELESLVDIPSVEEAGSVLEDLSRVLLPDGSRLTKAAIYNGYELWWMHYTSLFNYICLPLTQYKRLLEYLAGFRRVTLFAPAHEKLFRTYLESKGLLVEIRGGSLIAKLSDIVPFGVLVQIVINCVSAVALALSPRHAMVFTGDKFEPGKDYDFRMRLVYEELRRRNIRFVEFIRSLEPWHVVVAHAFKRRRPVVYSEGVTFVARFLNAITGGPRRARSRFGIRLFAYGRGPETQLPFLLASAYLDGFYEDIWSIRIMRLLLKAAEVRAGFITVASERNLSVVLGAKLSGIPTVGILHGVATRYSALYDFLPSFDGEKKLSVDTYGVWSEWWRDYYIKESRAYTADQLKVSGPMRPVFGMESIEQTEGTRKTRVLFISEQVAEPAELLPYLDALLAAKNVSVTLKFRPYRDGFEQWLTRHNRALLHDPNIRIVHGPVDEAIRDADVVVGSYSTAVLEALLQLKAPVFFHTRKWGDYHDLGSSPGRQEFFASHPKELVAKVLSSKAVPKDTLAAMRTQYFGDQRNNGSVWVVDRIERLLKECGIVTVHEK